jgi:hypothetical protein
MPFKTFLDYAFSNDPKVNIPKGTFDKEGKVLVPDILKYNSSITSQYLLQLFILNGPLNSYLDRWFNNPNLFYIQKDELIHFIKKCIRDYKIQRNSIPFIKRKYDTKLFTIIRKKCPTLKNDDISLLCEIVDKREDKDLIYHSLNLEKPEKSKQKKLSDRDDVNETNVKKWIEFNFSLLKY